MAMKGYKAFNSDWTCRDFQYKVGETYEMDGYPILCKRGFHFCTNPVDCFKYYKFGTDTKIAEVEVLGEITDEFEPGWANSNDSKRCTNKIKIVRELSLEKAKIKVVKKKIHSILHMILHPYAVVREPVISEDMVYDYITVEIIQSIKFSEEE